MDQLKAKDAGVKGDGRAEFFDGQHVNICITDGVGTLESDGSGG